jgi:putative protease
VNSLKIEGRLRSAYYVDRVVRAYRTVLNEIHDSGQVGKSTFAEAEEYLREAMGRRTTTGYFSNSRPQGIISPYHSGNIGIFLGRVEKKSGKDMAGIRLKKKISVGDRLRLHREKSGERVSFTLKQIQMKGEFVRQAEGSSLVGLGVPKPFYPGDSLYKVDTKAGRSMERNRRIIDPARFTKQIAALQKKISVDKILDAVSRPGVQSRLPAKGQAKEKLQRQGARIKKQALPLKIWVKTDQLQLLKQRLPFPVEHMVVALNHDLFHRFLKIKNLKAKSEKIIWALPPVILEEELQFFETAIHRLRKYGYLSFQLGHISQLQFFHKKAQYLLSGDYTLNVLNSQALGFMNGAGLKTIQGAIESDKHTLQDLAEHLQTAGGRIRLGMTVYGTPPLFTSRLAASHFVYGKTFVSPKDEKFVLKRQEGLTIALSERPFSLLPALAELSAMGFDYGVIDLCNQQVKAKDIDLLSKRLAGKVRERKLSTFNYEGQLL